MYRNTPEVYAILRVSESNEIEIRKWLYKEMKFPLESIRTGLHLTVYYARRILPQIKNTKETVNIHANIKETRFMVLAPGGENPREELIPSKRSVGIRLTRRNVAIEKIQILRKRIYSHETKEVIGTRKPTSAWRNCFGARHYQPHISLLRPHSGIDSNLSIIGEKFRATFDTVTFDQFIVSVRQRRY